MAAVGAAAVNREASDLETDRIAVPPAQYVFFHAGTEAAFRRIADRPTSFTAIPTVDLADLDSQSTEARRVVARNVADACRRCGFFYVENHGLSAGLIDDTFSLLARFFALDPAVKMDAHVHKNPAIRGYEPVRETRLDPRTAGDVKEAFTMGDCALEPEQAYTAKTGCPPPGHLSRPQNLWPAAAPWWRAGLYRYYGAVLPLALRLARVFTLALGLPESALDDQFRFPITGLRALYYPPTEDAEVGLGAHADFSWLTLVLQDDVAALEVLSPDGVWVQAPPRPGTLVCNVGQYLERQTGGLFPATVHRVRNRTGRARYSLPFFLTMDPDAVVDVLDCCRRDDAPKPAAEPISAGDLYIGRVLPARPKHPTSIRYADVPQEQWSYSMLLS
ncbi:2og-Fe oxygenase family protein [Grosmannia clavigera kw1407]|uniref:2og-Fe oxygenase family protein n=1 Tax=Grosmannia clavigera (strain kw1407 / UAMH 11150) TaxID=655863 RepID=F0XQH0_GROCL|nr:2og-Fe oxygenase family protein [Grosmannia clavigera kw1407]EFX00378.1 2og-Fe oxygenase family protein [Grosmannia clavigera kw1407]